jgi:hypothetical protein
MGYWNDIRLPEVESEEYFSWALQYGLSMDYYLHDGFRARLGLSRWEDKVTPGNIKAFRSLEISLTSFSLGLLYGKEIAGFDIYGGAKASFLLVQNHYELLKGTGNLDDREQGQDYSGSLILGINKILNFGLLAGIELNYTLGNYSQSTSSGGITTSEIISIHGPYIGINLGYRFD